MEKCYLKKFTHSKQQESKTYLYQFLEKSEPIFCIFLDFCLKIIKNKNF